MIVYDCHGLDLVFTVIVVIIMMDWNWSMVHVVSKNANSVSLDTV